MGAALRVEDNRVDEMPASKSTMGTRPGRYPEKRKSMMPWSLSLIKKSMTPSRSKVVVHQFVCFSYLCQLVHGWGYTLYIGLAHSDSFFSPKVRLEMQGQIRVIHREAEQMHGVSGITVCSNFKGLLDDIDLEGLANSSLMCPK